MFIIYQDWMYQVRVTAQGFTLWRRESCHENKFHYVPNTKDFDGWWSDFTHAWQTYEYKLAHELEECLQEGMLYG